MKHEDLQRFTCLCHGSPPHDASSIKLLAHLCLIRYTIVVWPGIENTLHQIRHETLWLDGLCSIMRLFVMRRHVCIIRVQPNFLIVIVGLLTTSK